MKPEQTKRELKEETLGDLHKGLLYLQRLYGEATHPEAIELLLSAIAGQNAVIERITKELEDPNL
jgi:hypothetical protein